MAAGIAVLALALPGAALAAAPTATTGGVSTTTPTTTVLHGSVNPEGHATTYFFQYGSTSLYGAQTTPASAGTGHSKVTVTAGVGGLIPNTTYHYRLVGQYSGGIVKGKDATFTTRKQPLALSVAAVPNPLPYGESVTLSGALTGTNNQNQAVELDARAFPFTTGFAPAANSQVTNAQGGFSFPFLAATAPKVTTQYQVRLPAHPTVVTGILTLSVAYRSTIHTSSRHVLRRSEVRFSGTIAPRRSGVEVLVQRKHRSRWTTLGRVLSHSGGRFSKHVRITRGGSYRIEVHTSGGDLVSGFSSTVTLHTHR